MITAVNVPTLQHRTKPSWQSVQPSFRYISQPVGGAKRTAAATMATGGAATQDANALPALSKSSMHMYYLNVSLILVSLSFSLSLSLSLSSTFSQENSESVLGSQHSATEQAEGPTFDPGWAWSPAGTDHDRAAA